MIFHDRLNEPKNNNITRNELIEFFEYLEIESTQQTSDKKETKILFLEKCKFGMFFKTFNAYQTLNSNLVKIATNNVNHKYNLISFSMLKVKDKLIQKYILIVFQLYILYILPTNLTAVIFILILK